MITCKRDGNRSVTFLSTPVFSSQYPLVILNRKYQTLPAWAGLIAANVNSNISPQTVCGDRPDYVGPGRDSMDLPLCQMNTTKHHWLVTTDCKTFLMSFGGSRVKGLSNHPSTLDQGQVNWPRVASRKVLIRNKLQIHMKWV